MFPHGNPTQTHMLGGSELSQLSCLSSSKVPWDTLPHGGSPHMRLVHLLIVQLAEQQHTRLCEQHRDALRRRITSWTSWEGFWQNGSQYRKNTCCFSRKFMLHHRKEKQMAFNSVKLEAAFTLLFREGLCCLGPVAMECQQPHLTSRTLGDCKELTVIKFFCPRFI